MKVSQGSKDTIKKRHQRNAFPAAVRASARDRHPVSKYGYLYYPAAPASPGARHRTWQAANIVLHCLQNS
jgi:hypothetical protein